VQAGGYVISCNWHGYAWTSAGPSGSASTITPANFSSLAAGGQLCASGSVAPQSNYGGYGILGLYVNQATGASTPADPVTVTGTGLVVNVTNTGGSALRVQIQDELGATDATHRWCATITGSGGTIPWSSFNTACWDGSGTAYAMQPINAVLIMVPGSNTVAVPFDFCLNSVSQAGGACGSSGTGGTGGTGGATGGTGGTTGGTGGTTGGTGGTAGSVNCNGTMPSGGTPHTSSNASGTAGGLSWSLWTNSGPGTMTTYNVPAFSASWGGSGDFLARLGLEWGNSGRTYTQFGTITAQFAETKSGTAGGYSYVGVYGWSYSPCVEYYIIDDSYNTMPVNPGSTTNKGTANIDGGTYNLYTRSTTGTGGSRCSGVSSWMQFYSVRRTARTCGTISVTQHFDAWAAAGMPLGYMIEAKVLIEAGGGTGSIQFTTANVTAQ
jgi:hypothetical protein